MVKALVAPIVAASYGSNYLTLQSLHVRLQRIYEQALSVVLIIIHTPNIHKLLFYTTAIIDQQKLYSEIKNTE